MAERGVAGIARCQVASGPGGLRSITVALLADATRVQLGLVPPGLYDGRAGIAAFRARSTSSCATLSSSATTFSCDIALSPGTSRRNSVVKYLPLDCCRDALSQAIVVSDQTYPRVARFRLQGDGRSSGELGVDSFLAISAAHLRRWTERAASY